MPGNDKSYVLGALTKQAVRSGKNKRRGHVTSDHPGCGHANIMGHDYQSFLVRRDPPSSRRVGLSLTVPCDSRRLASS